MPGVSGALIADRLVLARGAGNAHDDVRFVPSWSEVAPLVAQIAVPGDLIVTVGAGDVTMIGPEILRLLSQRLDPTAVSAGQQ